MQENKVYILQFNQQTKVNDVTLWLALKHLFS